LAAATAWRRFLELTDDAELRAVPRPGVWSPLQYAAHSRDMLQVFADRIVLALAEEDPVVPWFDPGPDGWLGYNRLDPSALADDLDICAARLDSVLAGIRGSGWSRTARRDGVDRFSVAGLACFAVHEAHHHLLDAEGSL
jgi:hypothetical protein